MAFNVTITPVSGVKVAKVKSSSAIDSLLPTQNSVVTATIRQTSPPAIADVGALTSPQTQPALDLKNNPAALKINNMASLADVDASDQVDGGVLVYSNTTHTYVVRRIDDGTF